MNIPKFFIQNKQFTLCIFILVAIWGVFSFRQMPKSEDPLFPLPQYSVVCIYPGATPSDLEQLVVTPIESQLGTLTDIESIKTQINDGMANIRVKFLQHVDQDKKYDEVQREINKLQASMPAGLKSIEVIQSSTSNVNILQYAITSNSSSYREMQYLAEDMKKAVEKAKNVREVKIHAYPSQQMNVHIDVEKIALYGLTLQNISNAIQSESTNVPSGYMDLDGKRFNIKANASYNTAEDISNTIIKSSNGAVVYLKDVATVEAGYDDQNYLARYKNKKAVFLTVTQQDNANIFDLTEEIQQYIAPFQKANSAMEITKVFDQSQSVSHRLDGLYRDFVIAILLVLITLLPLGLRASYVVMFSIPISIFIGIGLLKLFGYSLNQFSIVGLVIALGLLVDDSIIVVENIVARLRKGDSPDVAAISGTNQLITAILTVTACILLSFLPLVTLDGATGDFIRSLPLAVIFTMVGSLIVSLSLTPLLSKWLLKPELGNNVFYKGIMKFNEGPFMHFLHYCMKRPKQTLIAASLLVLGGFLLLKVVGFSFFPSAEKPQFLIDVTLPIDASIAKTDETAKKIEHILDKENFISDYLTNVGKGNPQVYYNLGQARQKANTAQFFCFTQKYDKDYMPKFLDDLRAKLSVFPGVKVQIKEFMQGPPVEAPLEIRIFGDDQSQLKNIANHIETVFNSTPGTQSVNNPLSESKSEMQLIINKEKALALGVSLAEISKTVRMTFSGIAAGSVINNRGDDIQIVLEVEKKVKENTDVFKKILVTSTSGSLVPLQQVAHYEFKSSPTAIEHYNQSRSVTITSAVKSGYQTAKVNNQLAIAIKNIKLPEGYRIEIGGEAEKRSESFGGLATALMMALLAIIALLVLVFKGFRGTIIVASAIPLGILGAVLALFFGGYTFSFTAFIGIITLIGLEVKNTIIILDFTNQLRDEGKTKVEAIMLATEERFTPIFLTTLTAVFALVPLVMERSDFFSPLALVLIGGLLSSLLLTRFVTPVLYKILMK